jgi:integrase/recombinase XerD
VRIELHSGVFNVFLPYVEEDIVFLKSPSRAWWSPQDACWCVQASGAACERLESYFGLDAFGGKKAVVDDLMARLEAERAEPLVQVRPFQADPSLLSVSFGASSAIAALVRSVPGRRYHRASATWAIPATQAALAQLRPLCEQAGARLVVEVETASLPSGSRQPSPLRRDWFAGIGEAERDCLQRYCDTLLRQYYSHKTLKGYVHYFRQFLVHFGADQIGQLPKQALLAYFDTWVQRGVAESTLNSVINAVKFYYEKVLCRPSERYDWARPRKRQQLPDVMSKGEAKRLFEQVRNPKQQVLLYTAYAAGLRPGEVVSLRVQDVQPERGLIRVFGGKGKKDRCVMLSMVLQG